MNTHALTLGAQAIDLCNLLCFSVAVSQVQLGLPIAETIWHSAVPKKVFKELYDDKRWKVELVPEYISEMEI